MFQELILKPTPTNLLAVNNSCTVSSDAEEMPREEELKPFAQYTGWRHRHPQAVINMRI